MTLAGVWLLRQPPSLRPFSRMTTVCPDAVLTLYASASHCGLLALRSCRRSPRPSRHVFDHHPRPDGHGTPLYRLSFPGVIADVAAPLLAPLAPCRVFPSASHWFLIHPTDRHVPRDAVISSHIVGCDVRSAVIGCICLDVLLSTRAGLRAGQ